jgi:hypothetical protein
MISPNTNNRPFYLSGEDCVPCEVGTDILATIYINFNRQFYVLKAITNGAIRMNKTAETAY